LKKAILYVTLVLTAFASCKSTKKVSSATSETHTKDQKLTADQLVMYTNYYFNASREKMLGNIEEAESLFKQCIRLNPEEPSPYYELATIYTNQNKFAEALQLSRRATEIAPKNEWFLLLYAGLLERTKQPQEAVHVYEKLTKQNPEKMDYKYQLADALINAGKLLDAIKIYDEMEKIFGVTEEISVQKERLYIKAGNYDKAVNEVKKLISSNPTETRYLHILGELYTANNKNEEAFEIYKQIERLNSQDPYVHLSLADYYRSKNEKEKAYGELKKAFETTELDIDIKIKILLSYYSLTENDNTLKDQAFELSSILVEKHPGEAKAFAINGDFLYRERRLEEARKNYRKAIELDNSRFPLWSQLLVIDSELSDHKALEEESAKAMELFPTQPVLYLFNGIAKIQLKDYQKAIDVLNEGRINVVDNKGLMSQFYANLGDAYNYIKNYKESDANYDKALEVDPENVYVLNNYSYYLSLRADRLEEAAELSARCNELEPNNASYQDTYGWILYHQNKLEEARNWLEKAVQGSSSKNSVILEHYGDVLFKLNEKEKAYLMWQNAKEKGKGSEYLDKKLAEKRLIE
jgi:tetratricopeptide (TPR) repeat protein